MVRSTVQLGETADTMIRLCTERGSVHSIAYQMSREPCRATVILIDKNDIDLRSRCASVLAGEQTAKSNGSLHRNRSVSARVVQLSTDIMRKFGDHLGERHAAARETHVRRANGRN